MYLKPADGRAPRDPQTGMRLLQAGQEVSEHDPHWAILRRDGDVVECEPPPPVSEVQAERDETPAEHAEAPSADIPVEEH